MSTTRSVTFEKWEATGNDFLFINSQTEQIEATALPPRAVQAVCHRETGRGADGVILFRPPGPDRIGEMTVVNSDGSLGGMCGNALRCLAKILFAESGRRQNQVRLAGRTVSLDSGESELSEVVMGEPTAIADTEIFGTAAELSTILETQGHLLSFGNPHLVVPVDKIPDNWIALGQAVQETAHQLFQTGGINCGFVERALGADGETRQLRVFERGAGATQACGSGACAASAVLEHVLQAGSCHKLELPGGLLQIGRSGKAHTLKGPANKLYEGIWNIDL